MSLKYLLVPIGICSLNACRATESHGDAAEPVPLPVQLSVPLPGQVADVDPARTAFEFLLQRYDSDGDGALSSSEYKRHQGQFARWDTNEDGRISAEDWSADTPRVMPEITSMQRMDVLGRYFQTDDNAIELLTIDELAEAFYQYDEAGNLDEELVESEFRAGQAAHQVAMPGDGSMMMQSYVGDADGWTRLLRFYDADGSKSLNMLELSAGFEDSESYELRFDRVRFDDGAPGAAFEQRAYREGLTVGSAIPAVTLMRLEDGSSVALEDLCGLKSVALIFGSYT
ncbi:MAG: hypothetical protein ACI8QC_003599 [Planctomycetota bacterium]|jgi:hypothetical protein